MKYEVLDSVLEDLERDADSQIFELGSQIYVEHRGVVLADAAFGIDGLHHRMTTDTLHPIYCASKPFLAATVAIMVEQDELQLETRVKDVLSDLPPTLGDLTIEEILSHRAGLFVYPAEMFGLVPQTERWDALISGSERVRPREWGTYADFAGWYLLGLVVETATTSPLRELIQDLVIDPLDLSGDVFVGFDSRAWAQNQDRLACNCDMRAPYPIPLLMEVSEQVCLDIRAANGVYASAKGLGRFYAGLGKTLGGRSVLPGLSSNTLQQFVDQSAPSHYDVALGRSCSYGLGFMVRLAEHRFGRRCSGSSFGHGGFEGLTFGLYDPEVDLSLALHHNGIVDGSLSLGKRREARVDSVYEYLGL